MTKLLILSANSAEDLIKEIYEKFYNHFDLKFYKMNFTHLPFEDTYQVDIEWEEDEEPYNYWKVFFESSSGDTYACFIKAHCSYNNILKIVDALNEDLFVTPLSSIYRYVYKQKWLVEGSDYCTQTKESMKADYQIDAK